MDADWVNCATMIATSITAVTTICYTVATFFICRANNRSSIAAIAQTKSMQEQSAELIRQYRESTRARVAVRLGYDNAIGRYLILKNVGRADAQSVKVEFSSAFMKALDEVFPGSQLRTLETSMLHIAAGQEFPVFVCFASALDRMRVTCLDVIVKYKDATGQYESRASIDFSQYGFLGVCKNSKFIDGKHIEETLEVKG